MQNKTKTIKNIQNIQTELLKKKNSNNNSEQLTRAVHLIRLLSLEKVEASVKLPVPLPSGTRYSLLVAGCHCVNLRCQFLFLLSFCVEILCIFACLLQAVGGSLLCVGVNFSVGFFVLAFCYANFAG